MGCPLWASRIALLLLVAAAICTVHAAAWGDHPFNRGRQLMQTACHTGTGACSGTCILCPYNQCREIPNDNDGGGGLKPTCTNIFFGATVPVLPIRNVDVALDGDLCTGWVGSNAIYLAPMYTAGNCQESQGRRGALYAYYDCTEKRVCFKATTCVGKTTQEGHKNFQPGDFSCPGVACGCAIGQAARECVPLGLDVNADKDENWFMLKPPCPPNDTKTNNDIAFANTQGVQTGWESCARAAENELWTVQAHFNIGSDTIDNQRPNSQPHYIQFRTPSCPSGTTCPSEPVNCPTANKVINCASSGEAKSASIQDCLPSNTAGLTIQYVSSNPSVTVNSDGGFTCPASSGSFTITVNVRLTGSTSVNPCYSYTVTVNGPAAGPNLSISKSATPTSVFLGDTVTYTITVGNTGGTAATGVTVKDVLPTGIVPFPATQTLPTDCSFSGQNLTCTNQQVPVTLGRSITYTARALATGFLNNSATLESASGDKGPAVVQVKVETTCEKARLEGADVKAIVCSSGTQRKPNSNDTTPASQNNCCESVPSAVTITKTANVSNTLISRIIEYTIVVNNTGAVGVTDAVVTDTLPAGLVFHENPSSSDCSVRKADNSDCQPLTEASSCVKLRCNAGALAAGSVKTYIVRARAVNDGVSLKNTASVEFKDNSVVKTAGPVQAPVTVTRTCGVYDAGGGSYQCTIAGTERIPGSDDNTTTSSTAQTDCCRAIQSNTPAFSATKAVYRSLADSAPCGTSGSPCSITAGSDFFWVITATVTQGNYSSFRFDDTVDSRIVIQGQKATIRINSDSPADCNQGSGGRYDCTVTRNFVTNDVIQLRIPVRALTSLSSALTITNSANVTGTPSIGSPQSRLPEASVIVTPPSSTPAFSTTKAVHRSNEAFCGNSASTCSIPAGNNFFWVITATVIQGSYSSFRFVDTVDSRIVITNQAASIRVQNGAQTSCNPTTPTSGQYDCSVSGNFVTGAVIQLWIRVIAPGSLQSSVNIPNTAAVTGTPSTGSSQTQNPDASVRLEVPTPPAACDASIVKQTPVPNPVVVPGPTAEPPTTTIVTVVTVDPFRVCDRVVMTSTTDTYLDVRTVTSNQGTCTTVGLNVYRCEWSTAVHGLGPWQITATFEVRVPASSTITTLRDVGVIGDDDNLENNRATATVNIQRAPKPELSIVKQGPSNVVPINTPALFIVTAGVSNGVSVSELTLVEQLSGLDGAYFTTPYPLGCTPTAGAQPKRVDCRWLGPIVDVRKLEFWVISTQEGTVINTATVSAPRADNKTAQDDARFCGPVTCPLTPPQVSITKTVNIGNRQYVEPEQEFTYTVIPRLTQGTATLLDVRDIVEDGVTFLSVRPTSGCQLAGQFAFTCSVAPDTTITVNARARTVGTWTNRASVTIGASNATDEVDVTIWRPTCGDTVFGGGNTPFAGCPAETPYDENNADRFPPRIDTCCAVNPQDTPTIRIIKTSSADDVAPGETFTWTLRVTNEAGLNPITAEDVKVVDTFPAGVRVDRTSVEITGAANPGRCTFSVRTMTCNLRDIEPDGERVIRVTVTAGDVKTRRVVRNTAVVTCSTGGQQNPACRDDTEDEVTVTPAPPPAAPAKVKKSVTPKRGQKNDKFTFTIVVQPAVTGKTASSVVLTDVIDKSLTNVRLITRLGGKCSFDQGSYTLNCTWDKLRTKQTVSFEVRGTKAGVTENIAVLTFEGGRGTSTADIFIEEAPKGSCCDGQYTCYDGITEAECKAKGPAAIWTSWSAVPPVTCASSSFCKGACCSTGSSNCKCPWCRQTSKSECNRPGDKWVPGGDCNNPNTCPAQCISKCQPCGGPDDTSCCPGLACVCSGSRWGPKYVCAQVNPYAYWDKWGVHNQYGFKPRSSEINVVTDLLAPLGGTCGRVAGGLQCRGPGVDCVLDGRTEAGRCLLRSTLQKEGASCSGHGQCAGGLRCDGGTCRQAKCPASPPCATHDLWCNIRYTFDCQVFYAHTMSSFDV